MIKYNIIDNFLDQSVFDKMADKIMPIGHTRKTKETVVGLPWIYNHSQTLAEKEEPEYPKGIEGVTDIKLLDSVKQSFFYFLFYKGTITNYYQGVEKLVEKIDPIAIFRIQANLTLQQSERGRSRFHTDSIPDPDDNLGMVTSIFYMNTTNGSIILEDGTEIECRANRLLSFPYDTYHSAVSCTDQPYKLVINLNCFGTNKLWCTKRKVKNVRTHDRFF